MKSKLKTRKFMTSLLVLSTAAAVMGVGAMSPKNVFAESNTPAKSFFRNPHSKIKHVVYIIMDNVHQSDIQQMPDVMKFLHQGTLFTNDHTVLDSHTQDGMLSDMSGKYPSKTGVIDQGFFERTKSGLKYSSFAYWNSADADGYHHVTAAPNWTAFNQHGLNVGAVGAPDMELESTKEVTSKMMTASDQNKSDYLGVSVHHSNGTTTFGSPNLPYVYNAASWSQSNKTLGAFPGWSDKTNLSWSLQATYEMQTHGVPVTFTYLHDAHQVNGKQALPGTYKATLKNYDNALKQFFTKMNQAGLNRTNTLFVMTTDEGDHLMPKGELTTNLTAWLANNSLNQQSASSITVYGDSGALVYLKNKSELPKTLASLTAVPGWNYVADPTELQALHMSVSAAPDRNPSFVLFSKPNVYYGYKGPKTWSYNSNYLWNHGTVSPDILHIWAGMVGPGIKAEHTSNQWIDHTDIMPTIFSLLGYNLSKQSFDGVPAVSGLTPQNRPRFGYWGIQRAETVFKQLNAPVGTFGLDTLKLSTDASVNATNSTGKQLNQEIQNLTNVRNRAASKLQADILSAFQGRPVSYRQLAADTEAAQKILKTVAKDTQSQ
ncbi:alkaline phosphatase family protein [Alicyclobacillus sp. SO9]|uniref:alkaline phosphatase family protein n=1 Tax=Alicyclobacillus sp. SO9 TaxID=2665646 RepID=UPI0018E81987|nr:alkaline phosphatase family protein [Alicyclobacillus sp. SO9]QQE77670.1 sulfatase-like hydrolase/transferase [Alicyclobacillus sp. SO9]